MSDKQFGAIAETILSISLPVDPDLVQEAASRVCAYYAQPPASIALPAEEVADRILELWGIWLDGRMRVPRELRDAVGEAIAADPSMSRLGDDYFKLVDKLEEKCFMERQYAIALVGCAPLVRMLVSEQRLGLDRIRRILNVPGATFDAIRTVLASMGLAPAFGADDIAPIHDADVADVSGYFGDTPPDDADDAFRSLLGGFPRCSELGDQVCELAYIGFDPYLFMLYFELLTLERCDRFPGRAIYECGPRGSKVKALWNEMYHPTQENPYLNNAKSVYSLDVSWAETKFSRETQNGSLVLADIFDIMSELPYATRKRAARVIRSYLVLIADKGRHSTPIPAPGPDGVGRFVERVAESNSLTKGVLDQRLVDFLTRCIHGEDSWVARGLGSSVNETNASGRKYGDVEYLSMEDRVTVRAYEAHGGGLRDEYVLDHIHSLEGTVEHHIEAAEERGEDYRREVEVVYVAHDLSRLDRFQNGHAEMICGVPFAFRFVTFRELLDAAGGMEAVSLNTGLFHDLVHRRISRLPDAYPLKRRYLEVLGWDNRFNDSSTIE